MMLDYDASRDREHGQVLVLTALSLVVLLAFSGLAVDVGMIMLTRLKLGKMTDAAALAAASALSGPPSEADSVRQARAIARARQYMLMHGFNPDSPGNSLTVTFPASSPPDPPRKLVELRASQQLPLLFLPLIGIHQAEVSSGGRQGEAAPLDVVLVLDVSASMCYGNYVRDLSCETPLISNRRDPYDPRLPEDLTYNPPSDLDVNVRWFPFYQMQDAARLFIDQLDPRYDQIGVVSFSSNEGSWSGQGEARIHLSLTSSLSAAKTVIGVSPAAGNGVAGLRPGGRTNMAKGLELGIDSLLAFTPPGKARETAIGAIILFSDGAPTRTKGGVTPSGCSSSTPQNCAPARRDVMVEAQRAADNGIIIYTIFFAHRPDEQNNGLILQYLADLTDNRKLDAPDGYRTGQQRLFDPATGLLTGEGYVAYADSSFTENYFYVRTGEELKQAFLTIYNRIYTRLNR
jgi:hypothetical protein